MLWHTYTMTQHDLLLCDFHCPLVQSYLAHDNPLPLHAQFPASPCYVPTQEQAGNLASQLKESQKEMSRLRADLYQAEFDLERERSQLHESATVADKDKVSWYFSGYLPVIAFFVGSWLYRIIISSLTMLCKIIVHLLQLSLLQHDLYMCVCVSWAKLIPLMQMFVIA